MLAAAGAIVANSAFAQQKASHPAKNKTVKVFVTEKGTENRIAPAGTLTFESDPDLRPGTEFIVRLPLID